MAALWRYLLSLNFSDLLLVALDISVVAFVIYKFMMLIKGTRAVQLIKGLVVLVVASVIAERLHLTTINWLLSQLRLVIVVALPVVFQPELRRALEQLGRGKFFARPLTTLGAEDMEKLINELVRAMQVLAKNRTGALVVVERETGLNDYIETGIRVDGVVSAELLINIFVPLTPFHDGAAIIRGDRVVAAGCFLPLSESPYLSKQLGTRHRAALGISEISDAVVLIVSEETGVISVAEGGKLTRFLDEKNLRELLQNLMLPQDNHTTFLWPWRS
ncbi:diadenylate cyclase CdaA [Neomoorella thermoacetica]|uniref:diadenylate cyclase CdaA n=1 Tax=Neomoorella thermoacetica TaxID=1525 RepID=UPI0000540246|nr:diadenylate cyclase CdaA [Moorella thermoacetica]AKX95097.1 DNA integrity scanning protein DisA [Moorella thermoacetica]APC09457.1 DNA integrity scanning protein DisA [Moorella thermoacetica]OIQ10564.1 DNA integrity scanning protein DisA [Moorella thermoacetica]OIQ53229.1 DNA integrity scanning protein DisA [Moorella thermoacetica]GLI17212.1 membrane protein [Moorella thermoacetica]